VVAAKKDQILGRIETLRTELHKVEQDKGRHDPEVLEASQRLDTVITEYLNVKLQKNA
jgi:uncharacterized protein (DUF3084 family)